MTFNEMLKRWLVLGLGAAIFGGFATAAMLHRVEIATVFAPSFVPLKGDELFRHAAAARAQCVDRVDGFPWLRGKCERDWTVVAQTQHRDEYDADVQMSASKVSELLGNVTGFAMACFGVAAVWALWSFLRTGIFPMIWDGLDQIAQRANLRSKLSDTSKSRRFRKAEKDYQTLKSLFDNDLIDEATYLERKRKLTQSLQSISE